MKPTLLDEFFPVFCRMKRQIVVVLLLALDKITVQPLVVKLAIKEYGLERNCELRHVWVNVKLRRLVVNAPIMQSFEEVDA